MRVSGKLPGINVLIKPRSESDTALDNLEWTFFSMRKHWSLTLQCKWSQMNLSSQADTSWPLSQIHLMTHRHSQMLLLQIEICYLVILPVNLQSFQLSIGLFSQRCRGGKKYTRTLRTLGDSSRHTRFELIINLGLNISTSSHIVNKISLIEKSCLENGTIRSADLPSKVFFFVFFFSHSELPQSSAKFYKMTRRLWH